MPIAQGDAGCDRPSTLASSLRLSHRPFDFASLRDAALRVTQDAIAQGDTGMLSLRVTTEIKRGLWCRHKTFWSLSGRMTECFMMILQAERPTGIRTRPD